MAPKSPHIIPNGGSHGVMVSTLASVPGKPISVNRGLNLANPG